VQDPSTGQTVLQNLPTGGILFFETNYFGYGEPTMMESFYPMTTTPTHSNAASETALYFIFGMLVFMLILTVFILVLTANPTKKLKA
jgi:hypothetical protein